ncbi:MAG TPA: uroporphyrinogen decarboxylase family protein [Armatimonadota bacterium]|jgi:uroporphyrinogen decarboxylase
MMTPRAAIEAAIRFEPYDGPVPHLELEFQLADEMFGEHAIRWREFETIPKHKRRDELVRNARLWIRIAEGLGWNAITGIHWLPVEEQIETFRLIREFSGDRFMLTTGLTGSQGIPSSDEIGPLVAKMAEDPDSLMEDLEALCAGAIRDIEALTAGGADLVFLLTDYAYNQGPFFSPAMFRRYVSPFAKRCVDAIHKGGAFAIQHSDGDLTMLLDQMLEWGLDGLQSIDPMAGMDIAAVRAKVGKRWCLFGNVNCAYLQHGTADQIEESARYCLEHGPVDGTGYVYTSSNCIFEGVPPENYRTMLAVREAWTRTTH